MEKFLNFTLEDKGILEGTGNDKNPVCRSTRIKDQTMTLPRFDKSYKSKRKWIDEELLKTTEEPTVDLYIPEVDMSMKQRSSSLTPMPAIDWSIVVVPTVDRSTKCGM